MYRVVVNLYPFWPFNTLNAFALHQQLLLRLCSPPKCTGHVSAVLLLQKMKTESHDRAIWPLCSYVDGKMLLKSPSVSCLWYIIQIKRIWQKLRYGFVVWLPLFPCLKWLWDHPQKTWDLFTKYVHFFDNFPDVLFCHPVPASDTLWWILAARSPGGIGAAAGVHTHIDLNWKESSAVVL